MQVNLAIQTDLETDPDLQEERKNLLLRQIYNQFPEAIWERGQQGFKIFI